MGTEIVYRKSTVIFGSSGINLDFEFWKFNLGFFLSVHICSLLSIKLIIIKLIKYVINTHIQKEMFMIP